MTDYRTMAADLIDKEPVRNSDYSRETIMRRVLARTLEALDTERTRADKAEQRERELREGLEKFCKAYRVCSGPGALHDAYLEVGQILSRTLIQPEPDPQTRKYNLGDRLTKTKGSSWTGRVVGFYSTSLTPIGYAIESENEPGSVQIFPQAALSIVKGES